VLIYLERDMQRQLCTLFHYALKPHGFLFLGSAEAIDAASGLFDTVDRDARIYSTLVPEGKAIARLPQLERAHRFTQLEPKPASHLEQITGAGRQHVLALEQQAPPSVLVDAAGHILHLSPTVGRFFLPSEGPFTAELSAQVRPELRIDLKVALQRALENGEATLTPPIPVAFNGHHNVVAIQVAPVGPKDSGTGTRALVFFLDGGPTRPPVATNNEGDISRDEIRRLRQELTNAQQRLGTTLQEHNLASQELRAMNEELQSINEEYRSTAEELETSKEELQSMNEELQTVNAELRSKLETISTAHNDLQNLMDTTEIGTLFLDAHLRIKLFTPAVAKLFNITIADVGRVISDFTHRLVYEGLEDDATNVLRSLHSSEAEVMTRGGDWLTMRVRPYRTLDDRIEGVVVTFADITARKRAEDALAGEMRAMTRLQRLSTEMAEADQIEAPLTAILDAAIDLLEADFGKIRLYDDDTKTLRTAVHRGFEQPFLDRFAEIDASAGSPYGAAFARGQQIIIEDVEQQPTLAPILDQARAAGFHGFQATPLFTRAGKLVGVLATHFRQPRVFSDHDLRLIAICARQAADAINTYQLQQSVRASEARLRKVLETDAVGVLFFDGSGTLIDCNDAFLQMTGYTRAKVAAHELSWHIMTPPKGLPEGEAPMDILAATGRLVPFETEFLREDGTRRWMLITGRSVEKNLFAEYAIDITDRIRAQEERELLARELSHRVKNTLAVVQALAMQTSGDSVAAFREAFVGRLRALAETHTVLLDSNWQDANLKVLAEKAMAAYNSGSTNPVRIEGPATALNPKQALGVSLILHELATNATKYGALSVPEGLVHISWQTEAADGGKTLLRLTWREEGGPVVKAPEAGGFGSQLIVRACEYELDGTANLLYERKGVTAEIVFPLT
jgi:two-component system CheB/CheR fusion protein